MSGNIGRDAGSLFIYLIFYSLNSILMNYNQPNQEPVELSYYGRYLQNYLRESRFELADDTAFIQERADRAAEAYEQARHEGASVAGSQELAMATLTRGLGISRWNVLQEVLENEFTHEIPDERREAFAEKLLPQVENVFQGYDLSADGFSDSKAYTNLYLELTGAVVLYLEAYGI